VKLVQGLWLGIVCGSFAKLALLIFIAWCIDWEKEVNYTSIPTSKLASVVAVNSGPAMQ
jgi:hypothetical protein